MPTIAERHTIIPSVIMKKTLVTILLLAGLSHTTAFAQENTVIPRPAHYGLTTTPCPAQTNIIGYTDKTLADEAAFLKAALEQRQGKNVKVKQTSSLKRGIMLSIDRKTGGEEAYRMEMTDKVIRLTGGGEAGVFRAMQTLLQTLDAGSLHTGTITDAPRYAWRGIMLDEARHFFGKEKVKQILDAMAYYKLNKFHWHLTDETGWRLEIKQYPKLTSVGACGNWSTPGQGAAQYYTQEDVAEIVAYAAARHIDIIPEIDMPGHATAAVRAYPQLSGGGTPAHPDFTFHVGREATYTFLTNVLREVATLFPSQYIHLGGDEVSFGIKAWKTDPEVKELMRREGLADVKAAEHYFMRRMADSVRTMGKTMAGWDEMLAGQPDTAKTLIMWWRHDRPAELRRALNGGYSTVLCPRRPLYFDFIQHASHKWGRVWNGFCPLEDVYNFPDKDLETWGIDTGREKFIAGVQANVWTERIHTPQRLDFMLFPRLCAVAEAGWTQAAQKDYSNFSRRMEAAYEYMDSLNIYYFDPRRPDRHPEPAGAVQGQKDIPMDFRD
jgi:hexosaminidase